MTGRRYYSQRHWEAAHGSVGEQLAAGYSPWTGQWFRDPPADEPFAVDVDGTIILHPSQYRVLNTNEGNEA